MEWRRLLTPGTPVVLRFDGAGLEVRTERGVEVLAWSGVKELLSRGPKEPDIRWEDERWRTGLDVIAGVRRGPKSKFCWLAVALVDGGEIIFEVEGLLRDELEQVLVEHAG
jgi:hypothetical protein